MSDSDNQVKKYDPKKIQEFTRQGEFKGLHNKVEAIDSVIKERTQAIRRGEYDTSRQRGDYQRILKADSSLTDRNKKDVKKLLNTWGTQSQKLASPKSIPKAVKKELPKPKKDLPRTQLYKPNDSLNNPLSPNYSGGQLASSSSFASSMRMPKLLK